VTIEITFNDGPGALVAFAPFRIGVKDGITMWLPPGSVVNQFFSSSAVMIDGASLTNAAAAWATAGSGRVVTDFSLVGERE